MKKAIFLLILFSIVSLEGAYTVRKGALVHVDYLATFSPEEHFEAGIKAYTEYDWEETVKQFNIILYNFQDSPQAKEGYFYLGVAHFYRHDYEDANDAFSNYLKTQNHPVFLEDALRYKLEIANAFSEGARRRLLGWKIMPKILPAHDRAFTIYDEIIATYPCHDLAAQALYSKAALHWKDKEFRESIETFQLLIRRFPKHELAVEAYTYINKIYLEQCQYEYQNPDILALADLNHKKFSNDFPGEERVDSVKQDVTKIREVYAYGLFDTGMFYERTKKPNAAVIYYKKAIQQFPETETAKHCLGRLQYLGAPLDEMASAPKTD